MGQYTEQQKHRLLSLIAKWQERLRLQHWRIEVSWDEGPHFETCILEVSINLQIRHAEMRVGAFFDPRVSDAEQEASVCHELIHLHAEPLWGTVCALLDELGPQAKTHMSNVAARQLEQMVEALALSFVPVTGEVDHAKEVNGFASGEIG